MSLFCKEKNTDGARTWECVCARAPCVLPVQAFTWGKFYGQILRNRLFRRAWKKGGRMGELVGRASVCHVCAPFYSAHPAREWFIALGELVPSLRTVHTR